MLLVGLEKFYITTEWDEQNYLFARTHSLICWVFYSFGIVFLSEKYCISNDSGNCMTLIEVVWITKKSKFVFRDVSEKYLKLSSLLRKKHGGFQIFPKILGKISNVSYISYIKYSKTNQNKKKISFIFIFSFLPICHQHLKFYTCLRKHV